MLFGSRNRLRGDCFPLYKVLGTENVSDLMTKNMTAATILGYLHWMGLEYIEGRSVIAQQLHAVQEQSAERELQSTFGGDDMRMSVGSKPVKSRSEPFKTVDNILK